MSCCDTKTSNNCCSTNKIDCTCTYEPCSSKHKCCECISYHKENNELPACLFNSKYEKNYDRSITNYVKMLKETKLY